MTKRPMTDMQAIWVVRAGEGGRYASDFESKGMAAMGEVLSRDLSQLSRDEVHEHTRVENPGNSDRRIANWADQLHRFATEVVHGDWIITPDTGTGELLYGTVTGAYRFEESPPIADFHHVVAVAWMGRKPRDLLPESVLNSLRSGLTIFQPNGREHLLAFLGS